MIRSFIYLDGRWQQGENILRAEAIYRNRVVDLLSNDSSEQSYEMSLNSWIADSFSVRLPIARFGHLFYELGFLCESIGEVADDTLLAVFIDYEAMSDLTIDSAAPKIKLREKLDSVSFDSYESAFKRGYDHLLAGDCYQFNLTYPFTFDVVGPFDAQSFSSLLIEPSEYAHACDLPGLKISIVSNSPECLFEREGKSTLVTRPIKGTLKMSHGPAESLRSSEKDLAELDMITDLLRNDLNRIERPIARVRARHNLLTVPGLYHLYSEIAVELGPQCSVLDVVLSLFPGGSVTGAPKKRVMEILRTLENSERGIYCGSTLFFHRERARASVNIRTGVYEHDSSQLRYHAGGGCTLMSEARAEYFEMRAKLESFLMGLKS